MRYIDISLPIQPGMMVYKNKPEKQPHFSTANQLSSGGSYETTIAMNVHTGTHLDFPLHMQAQGINSSNFDPSRLITKVRVIDCGQAKVIDDHLLQSMNIQADEFILFKSRNSEVDTFLDDFTYLNAQGAAFCVQKRIRGVGIDALGIERNQPSHETHHQLMNAGIMILEGLRLKSVTAGSYLMIALPLSIPNLDALPVRAVLQVNE
jgi:arylformamidase